MKRMYANEELVKLIQENAPEVEVDDALSGTSENPVQNKVINTALGLKQDALPDTTGETGKFLKVGSDGLEWDNAGGTTTQCYLHIGSIGGSQEANHDIKIIFIDENETVTFDSLRTFLLNNNHLTYNSGYHGVIGNTNYISSTNELRVFDYSKACHLYAKENASSQIYFRHYGYTLISFAINDGAIICSASNQGYQSESAINKSGFNFYGDTFALLK